MGKTTFKARRILIILVCKEKRHGKRTFSLETKLLPFFFNVSCDGQKKAIVAFSIQTLYRCVTGVHAEGIFEILFVFPRGK